LTKNTANSSPNIGSGYTPIKASKFIDDIPARLSLSLSNDDNEEILEDIHDYLSGFIS